MAKGYSNSHKLFTGVDKGLACFCGKLRGWNSETSSYFPGCDRIHSLIMQSAIFLCNTLIFATEAPKCPCGKSCRPTPIGDEYFQGCCVAHSKFVEGADIYPF